MQIHVTKLQEHRHVLGHHLILLAITAVVIEVKTDVPIRNFEVIDHRHVLLESPLLVGMVVLLISRSAPILAGGCNDEIARQFI
jgi:hypothetical protein